MYQTEAFGSLVMHLDAGTSNVQKRIIGTMPADLAPWGVEDFSYDTEGIVVTGLSDQGKEKIKNNATIVVPDQGPTGKDITGLGDGTNMQGIFVYQEGGKSYACLLYTSQVFMNLKVTCAREFFFTFITNIYFYFFINRLVVNRLIYRWNPGFIGRT